jgi:hypothetical protein
LPVVGIINNPELQTLLGERGIFGSSTNREQTTAALKEVVRLHRSREPKHTNICPPFVLTEQVTKMLRP